MNRGALKPILTALGVRVVVLAEPPVAAAPGKDSLDVPSPRDLVDGGSRIQLSWERTGFFGAGEERCP